MKVSEITQADVANYCRIQEDEISAAELATMKAAAIAYAAGYTGLTIEELDEHDDIAIAVLCLIADMYDNRLMTVDKTNVNRTIDTIFGMHCVNWIADERTVI